ncbi:superoxide dismutase family protein [uncultured Algimonas sp.]|uniref:superoxide dismutase family protein n=1 Tax=uncultured Algimonas sp. TaxID=1547920 RepID=UPI00263304AC|nr:superoxide dismutase family protein [uncultured Algimonas sp.]
MKKILLATAAMTLVACGGTDDAADDVGIDDETANEVEMYDRFDRDVNDDAALMSATYPVINSAGSEIGTVTISDVEGSGVTVSLDVTAIPEGQRAIHFHETGSCDTPDFQSAGGHYNPSNANHGFEADDPNPHAGDMENFDAPASGVVRTEIGNDRVTLSDREGLAPLLDANGTALIIHAGADDYETQPSGDAGSRIACAVIEP